MKTQPAITHDRVEEAMRQFLKKGGKIEVLFPDLSQELLLKRELSEDSDGRLVLSSATEPLAVAGLDEAGSSVAD